MKSDKPGVDSDMSEPSLFENLDVKSADDEMNTQSAFLRWKTKGKADRIYKRWFEWRKE